MLLFGLSFLKLKSILYIAIGLIVDEYVEKSILFSKYFDGYPICISFFKTTVKKSFRNNIMKKNKIMNFPKYFNLIKLFNELSLDKQDIEKK